jgi:hypothetical protein
MYYFVIYRNANSVNHNSDDICDSAAIHCDGYCVLVFDAVHTCRHLPSLAKDIFTFIVGIEE